uniref:NADH dehydrogenase subunit 5 n=1 Tax=Dermatobranchus otome TaxID=1504997 RepID=UPI001FF60913|nr:NADH dehydrogenase subunit 5 [Dermatobranchus otome]UOD76583.1 NADH dehydrogenase subunit 5 [Dermatobranchus otome]UOD76596.1 NADH dehydrogenase subunit 5 [Dermatobranchus otome]
MLLFSYSLLFFGLGFLFLNVTETIIYEFEIFMLSGIPFTFSMILDKVSISFSMVVTLISGSVFFFSNKYMEEDPFSTRFIWILLSFVISMNLLIFSGSIFFILLGWDGLGITSFALIIYYESGESQMAGFQTLMINRIGDVLIVLSFFLFCCSGQFTIFSISDEVYYFSGVLTLLCVAALTKSAQFPFSSWLPAAMAAPTPVSALVHSSTLVTAGIFLVIRLSFSVPLSSSVSSLLLLCGSVTCLLGGWAATYENDIKKVIALSTLSQLGVMMFSLGMNFPSLALFHLYTHALFKALLFLAAGHILLMTYGSQDLRLIGGLGMSMPFTSLMFTVSSLCLIGAPFTSAFYSKHLILELMLYTPLNCVSVLLMLIATFMTAKYVFRTLKGVVWGKTGIPLLSGCSDVFTFLPVGVLGIGAIIGGEFISSVEISTLEFVFLPSFYSGLINLVTIMGVVMGLISSDFELKSHSLSTLFFLTPLVYGSPKIFSLFVKIIGVLDYGWMEPYFLIKNKMNWAGSVSSSVGLWPGTRLMISIFIVSFLLLIVSVFIY